MSEDKHNESLGALNIDDLLTSAPDPFGDDAPNMKEAFKKAEQESNDKASNHEDSASKSLDSEQASEVSQMNSEAMKDELKRPATEVEGSFEEHHEEKSADEQAKLDRDSVELDAEISKLNPESTASQPTNSWKGVAETADNDDESSASLNPAMNKFSVSQRGEYLFHRLYVEAYLYLLKQTNDKQVIDTVIDALVLSTVVDHGERLADVSKQFDFAEELQQLVDQQASYLPWDLVDRMFKSDTSIYQSLAATSIVNFVEMAVCHRMARHLVDHAKVEVLAKRGDNSFDFESAWAKAIANASKSLLKAEAGEKKDASETTNLPKIEPLDGPAMHLAKEPLIKALNHLDSQEFNIDQNLLMNFVNLYLLWNPISDFAKKHDGEVLDKDAGASKMLFELLTAIRHDYLDYHFWRLVADGMNCAMSDINDQTFVKDYENKKFDQILQLSAQVMQGALPYMNGKAVDKKLYQPLFDTIIKFGLDTIIKSQKY